MIRSLYMSLLSGGRAEGPRRRSSVPCIRGAGIRAAVQARAADYGRGRAWTTGGHRPPEPRRWLGRAHPPDRAASRASLPHRSVAGGRGRVLAGHAPGTFLHGFHETWPIVHAEEPTPWHAPTRRWSPPNAGIIRRPRWLAT